MPHNQYASFVASYFMGKVYGWNYAKKISASVGNNIINLKLGRINQTRQEFV
jgi:hypothetical protein